MKRFLPTVLTTALIVTLVFGFAELSEGQRDGRGGDRDRRGDRDRFRGPIKDFTFSALPQEVAAPADNPETPAKVELGRLLFWDPVLSGNQEVACATCHHPRFGYAENLDISIGVDGAGLGIARRFATPDPIPFVKRNSQTIINTGFNGIDLQGQYDPATAPMFWDSRVEGLEAQALLPIITFEEMRGHTYSEEEALDVVIARLQDIPEYQALFADAFGGDSAVNVGNLAKALAAFQRTLIANDSPYDRYMRGEANAMTRAQTRGMQVFEQEGCINCHNGAMFSDYKLHVLGIRDNRKLSESDSGAVDQPYAFRTPSLRNLAYTAPYMHNGRFQTLEDVIEFYDDVGDRDERNVNLERNQIDPLIRTLDDPDDRERELIEFLKALNDDGFDRTIPTEVPSGLNPGGRI